MTRSPHSSISLAKAWARLCVFRPFGLPPVADWPGGPEPANENNRASGRADHRWRRRGTIEGPIGHNRFAVLGPWRVRRERVGGCELIPQVEDGGVGAWIAGRGPVKRFLADRLLDRPQKQILDLFAINGAGRPDRVAYRSPSAPCQINIFTIPQERCK